MGAVVKLRRSTEIKNRIEIRDSVVDAVRSHKLKELKRKASALATSNFRTRSLEMPEELLFEKENNEMKNDINGIKQEMNGMKEELNGMKEEMNGMKEEMKEE